MSRNWLFFTAFGMQAVSLGLLLILKIKKWRRKPAIDEYIASLRDRIRELEATASKPASIPD